MQEMATLPPEMTRSVIADESHTTSSQLTKYSEGGEKDMSPYGPWSQDDLFEDNLDPPLFKSSPEQKKDLNLMVINDTKSLAHACVSC